MYRIKILKEYSSNTTGMLNVLQVFEQEQRTI